jgi:hypothetical protein
LQFSKKWRDVDQMIKDLETALVVSEDVRNIVARLMSREGEDAWLGGLRKAGSRLSLLENRDGVLAKSQLKGRCMPCNRD